MTAFVLALHSHLPYVLHRERWPHGGVWLFEAVVDSYLPLLEALRHLESEGVDAPLTIGITPVLANQLADPTFPAELEKFLDERLEGCRSARESLAHEPELPAVVEFWRERFTRLRDAFRSYNGDLVAAFRDLERRGRIELMSSAATHGFLPLLARDESVRLQLDTGRAEHQRLFGRAPDGCWLPECAYRPAGPWTVAGAPPSRHRPGIDEHLRAAGYAYCFLDPHVLQAGRPLDDYGMQSRETLGDATGDATPHRVYRLPAGVDAFTRDPRSALQVWSRTFGYPGDEWYLEFHKTRWPDGLKLWRVSGGDPDLGRRHTYAPAAARGRARAHADHFADLLRTSSHASPDGEVIAVPFDAELFGHWWFEGVDFLADVYRSLRRDGVRPTTARAHLTGRPARSAGHPTTGSWGAAGDFSMWLNDRTAWTWRRLWSLEETFWPVARSALAGGTERRAVLAQATRSLLLAQASDWQFIISTGVAADYGGRRLIQHCDDADALVAALRPDAAPDVLRQALARVTELQSRDRVFPDILDSLARVLA
jgi:1,4-alpha-glucan branching enzyme